MFDGLFKKEPNSLRVVNESRRVLSIKEVCEELNSNSENKIVVLTEEEFDMGCAVGCRRCRNGYASGKKDSYVNGREYDAHIQGVLAEIAVAKYLGLINDWKPTIDTYRELPDIDFNGKTIEVKSSGSKEKKFYIKQSTLKRKDDDIFVFVYCDIRQNNKNFECEIIGASSIEEVMKKYSPKDWIINPEDMKSIDFYL